MTTASATSYVNGLVVRVEVQACAADLTDDASRAADAAAEAIKTIVLPRPIGELREEYRAAMDGESCADCTDTFYGRMISMLESTAGIAAVEGWHNPDALVTVDVDAA